MKTALGLGLLGGGQAIASPELAGSARGVSGGLPSGQGGVDSVKESPRSAFETIKKEATREELYRFLYALPKGGDLHHHFGGGTLARRWFALATDARRNGGQRFYTRYRISQGGGAGLPSFRPSPHVFFWMTLREKSYEELDPGWKRDFKPMDELDEAEREAWISSVKIDRSWEGRDEFFEYIWQRLNQLLASIHVKGELLVENMQLLAAEGVSYVELMTGFRGWRDAQGNELPPAEADAYFRWRLAEPDARATGVTVRLKGVVLRFADNAEDQVRQNFAHVDRNRDLWCGFDMAGREDNQRGFPERFTGVFDEMMRKYPDINISLHAGESEAPNAHIFSSLRLGASRIGHGINLWQDPPTMQLMRNGKHLVEINLISNHLLQYTPDLDRHPFPLYLRQGIPCCLNTDDRGMWDSNMTDEFFVAVTRFNLSWGEVQTLIDNSLAYAFVDDSVKEALRGMHRRRMDAFTAQFLGSGWRSALASVNAETYGYGRRHLGLDSLARLMPHEGKIA